MPAPAEKSQPTSETAVDAAPYTLTRAQIVLVQPYDHELDAGPGFESSPDFHSRVVPVRVKSYLSPRTPEHFRQYGFRSVGHGDDTVFVNPDYTVADPDFFSIARYNPKPGHNHTRDYRSVASWGDDKKHRPGFAYLPVPAEEAFEALYGVKPEVDAGTRLLLRRQVLFVVPFDQDAEGNPAFKPKIEPHSRIILRNTSVLSPLKPADFGDHFHILGDGENQVAFNRRYTTDRDFFAVADVDPRSPRLRSRGIRSKVSWDNGTENGVYAFLPVPSGEVFSAIHSRAFDPASRTSPSAPAADRAEDGNAESQAGPDGERARTGARRRVQPKADPKPAPGQTE